MVPEGNLHRNTQPGRQCPAAARRLCDDVRRLVRWYADRVQLCGYEPDIAEHRRL